MHRKNIKKYLAGLLTAVLMMTILELPSYAVPEPLLESEEEEDDYILSEEETEEDPGFSEIKEEAYGSETGNDEGDLPEDEFVFDENNFGYMEVENPVKIQSSGSFAKGTRHSESSAGDLPDSYIPENLPPLRNQNPYGTCWAFSSVALAELNLMKQGIEVPDDLSELHLAYFTYHTALDPLGGTEGDNNQALEKNYLMRGGNLGFSSAVFANWTGAVSESELPYSQADADLYVNPDEAFTDRAWRNSHDGTAVHLTDSYEVLLRNAQNEIDWAGMEMAKKMVRDYGGVGISYYSPSGTSSSTNPGVYSTAYNCFYDPTDHGKTNHAVTIVGWDDNFPKENFPNEQKPAGDGAWLIRNNWLSGGTYANSQRYSGYFWMSYYNVTQSEKGYSFVFEPADNYDNNYQYDGSMYTYVGYSTPKGANVFTAHASGADNGESLKAASFYTDATNFNYTIEVYTDLPDTVTDPTNGTLASSVSGFKEQAGYHTIPLNSTVPLRPDDRFSIVVTLSKEGATPSLGTEIASTSNWYDIDANIEEGQSFFKPSGDSAWKDLRDYSIGWIGNLRIKAFTDNLDGWTEIPPETITFEDDLSTDGLLLGIGEEYRVLTSISPDNATDKKLNWESSAPAVATVSDKGVVTGVSDGTAVITVSARTGDASASFTVTVSHDKLSALEIGMNGYIGYCFRGKNFQFTLTPTPADHVIQGPVIWTSSDTSVMTIDSDGKARALKSGKTVITARAEGMTAQKNITVYPNAPANVKASTDEHSVVTLTWSAVEGADRYRIKADSEEIAVVQAVEGRETYSYTDEGYKDIEENYTVLYSVYACEGSYGMGSDVSAYIGPYSGISYVLEHGTNPSENPVRYRPGEYHSLRNAVPDEGYRGGEWYSDSSYTNRKYSISYTDTGNITLYAKIVPIQYTIRFMGNGGTNNTSMASVGASYNEEITLPANVYTMTGAQFAGWNTAQDGTGDSYADQATVKNLSKTHYGNVYLYAQWKYPVTLDPNGGSLGENEGTKEVYYGRTYGELPVPEREGYNFLGWFTGTYSGSGEVSTDTTVVRPGPHTIYAHWERKPAASVGTEPEALENLIYTGSPQVLVSAGSSSQGTVLYRLGSMGEYKEALPTGTNADTYTVYYKVSGDATHSDSAENSLTVTILPAELTAADAVLTERVYAPGNRAVGVSAVTFKDKDGETVSLAKGIGYTAEAVLEDESAGDEKTAVVTVTLLNTNYRLRNNTLTKKVKITKASHADPAASASAGKGQEGTLDLSAFIEQGGQLGTVTVTSDTAGLLNGTPSVSGKTLRFRFRDGEFAAGTKAYVNIAVSGAANYQDYQIRATLSLTLCDHEYRVTVIDPTFYADGLKITACIKCGDKKEEVIPKITQPENISEEDEKLSEDAGEGRIEKTIVIQTDETGRETLVETVKIGNKTVSTASTDPETGNTDIISDIWVGGLHASYGYTGSAIKPSISVYDGTKLLKEKTDYKLTYGKNTNVSTGGSIKITFTGNYKSTAEKTLAFAIAPPAMEDVLFAPDIAMAAKGSAGNEKVQTPSVSVMWKDTAKALSNKQFDVAYRKGTAEEPGEAVSGIKEPGEYTAFITPKNGNFTGSLTAGITVTGSAKDDKNTSLSNAKITLSASGKKKIWTGDEITLTEGTDFTVKDMMGETLTGGIHYTVSYLNNVNPGTAAMILTAIDEGGYIGTKKQTFKIKKGRAIGNTVIEYDHSPVYVKGGAKPVPTVTDNGRVLRSGKDYSVIYKKNTSVTGSATAYMIVKGKGNYKGSSQKLYYTISPKALDGEDSGITWTVADKASGKKGYKNPSVTILDSNGKKLSGKKDYEITWYGEPDENGVVTITISARKTNPCYTGSIEASYHYLSSARLIGKKGVKVYRSLPAKAYTGYAVTLSDEELKGLLYTGSKDSPVFLTPGEDGDFKVLSYSGNQKKGTAKVTLQGLGDFAGTRTLSFKITDKKGSWCGILVDGEWK